MSRQFIFFALPVACLYLFLAFNAPQLASTSNRGGPIWANPIPEQCDIVTCCVVGNYVLNKIESHYDSIMRRKIFMNNLVKSVEDGKPIQDHVFNMLIYWLKEDGVVPNNFLQYIDEKCRKWCRSMDTYCSAWPLVAPPKLT